MLDESGETNARPVVAIIGATGRVGQHVFRGAVERGYVVRALARNPSKIDAAENVTVVQGSVLDAEAVKRLMLGVNVVISCLGSRPGEDMVVAPGTRVIVDAIQALLVKPRLVHISSLGIGDSYRQCRKLSWIFALVMIPVFLRKYFVDMEEAEKVLRAAPDISMVVVRPTALRDKAEPLGYQCRTAEDRPGRFYVSRQDVAAFMLDTVEDTARDGKAVSLFSA